jgi:TolA-binding protein
MRKLTLALLLTISVNADSLKDDEFDIIKLGKAFESYVIQTDNKLYSYQKTIDQLYQKVATLETKIEQLQQSTQKVKTKKEDISTEKISDISIDRKKVETKKGIIAYSAPFSEDELYLKRYDFGTYLNIEFCDQYGWCKIKDKEEYVAGYLLSNENK